MKLYDWKLLEEETGLRPVVKGGRCANGAQRDRGSVVHIASGTHGSSICYEWPGRLSVGQRRRRVVQLDPRVGTVVPANLRHQRPGPPSGRGVHRQLQPSPASQQLRDASTSRLRTSPRSQSRRTSRPGGSGVKPGLSDRRRRHRNDPMAPRCDRMRGFKPNQKPSTVTGEAQAPPHQRPGRPRRPLPRRARHGPPTRIPPVRPPGRRERL